MGGTLTPDAWTRLLAFATLDKAVRKAAAEKGGGASSVDARGLARAKDELAREIDCDLATLYLDLIAATGLGPLTIAQVGQSLDGRTATRTGHSQYINGGESLDHLHRLRALVDAVVVGATTVALDDPQLTTRRVDGPSPTRVVLDPRGRLGADANVFDDSAPTLVIVDAAAGRAAEHPATTRGIPVLPLPATDGRLPPAAILACLRQRGLRTVLIEGGAHTISTFLVGHCIDRMHVAVAPMLIGSGTAAISLPPIDRLDEAVRFSMRPYRLGSDVVFDCVLPPRAG